MKKIISILVVSVLILGLFLTGCQNKSQKDSEGTAPAETSTSEQDQAVSSEKQANIRFVWINMPDETKKAWEKTIFEPFEKKFPNIKVDFQAVPNVADTIKVQVAAGQGPDLFMTDAYALKEYAKADSIHTFDPYVTKYGWDKVIYDWALNSGKYDGKQYAIPHAYECTFLIYNKDLLDANGWTVPKTRAEFEKVCEEASKKGIIPIAYGNSGVPDLNQWLIDHYLANYSDNEATKDLFTGKTTFDDPKIKGAFELLKSDWDKGYWNDKKSSSLTMDGGRALWTGGKALFTAEGSWFTEVIAQGVDFNYGYAKWPSMKDGVDPKVSVGIGAVICASKTSKVIDQSAELLNFMYSEEKNIVEGIALGLQPIARNIDTKLLPETMDKNAKTALDALLENTKQGEKVGYTPWTYYPAKTNQYLFQGLDKLFYNKISIDEYLKGAQKVLDQELKDGFKFPG